MLKQDALINIFVSYEHDDEKYYKQLIQHTTALSRMGLVNKWLSSYQIKAGTEQIGETQNFMLSASIILLLISPSYLASEYCYDFEMKYALERHNAGAAQVIPIIVRPTADLSNLPLRDLQFLPRNGKAISQWQRRDEAFVNIAQGIRRAIEDLQRYSTAQNDLPSQSNDPNQISSSSITINQASQSPDVNQTHQSQQPKISFAPSTASSNNNVSPIFQVNTFSQSPSHTTPSSPALVPSIVSKEGIPDAMKATTDKAVQKLSEDKLNFAIWVKALGNFIKSPDTTTPLTIGIDGAWGTGKTSFMYMLKDLLEPSRSFWTRQDEITWPWLKWFILFITTLPIWIIGKFTIWIGKRTRNTQKQWLQDIINGLSYDSEYDVGVDITFLSPHKRFWAKIANWHSPRLPITYPTIWFNAWKFDQEEQLWAALALAVLDQIKNKYSFLQKIIFWARLQFTRFSWQNALYFITLKIILPVFLGLLAWKFDVFIKLTTGIYPKGSSQTLTTFFPLSQTLLWIGAILSGIIQIASIIKDPFQIPIERVFNKPDYKARVGFIGSFEEDFSSIVSIVTRPTLGWKSRKLIIFIDDLDRCKLPKAVDIIEGINLFLDSEQCVFVIGMDTTAVIASVETKYQDLFKQIQKERPELISAGRFFLDKIIQVPIHVPPSIETGIEKLVRDITEHGLRPLQIQQNQILSTSNSVSSSLPPSNSSPQKQQIGRITRRLPTQPLSIGQLDSASYSREEVREAILLGAHLLPENPRQVKRFINLFRLYVYIANEQNLFEEENQIGLTMNRLAVWTAWSIRWGELARLLSQEVSLQLAESTLLTQLIQIAKYLEKDGCWIKSNLSTNGIESNNPTHDLINFIRKTRGDEEHTASHWSHLPWELWLRDQDFLKCIKELETFWLQPQSNKIDWLQSMLLMTRVAPTTNTGIPTYEDAQLQNQPGTSPVK